MSGQGKYKRCTRKHCRLKAQEHVTAKGEQFCEPHLLAWVDKQIHGLGDFGLALDLYLEGRIREAVRKATDEAAS